MGLAIGIGIGRPGPMGLVSRGERVVDGETCGIGVGVWCFPASSVCMGALILGGVDAGAEDARRLGFGSPA